MKKIINAAQAVKKYKALGYFVEVVSRTIEVDKITRKPTKWVWDLSLEKRGIKKQMTVAYRSEIGAGMKALENAMNK